MLTVNELVEKRRMSQRGGHGFVLGCAGSGKTLTVMEQIKAILVNSRDTVVVLDMDGSYRAFADELDGQRIVLDGSSDVFINPFDAGGDLMSDTCDNPIWEKVDFFQFWLDELLGGKLTARQRSLVDRAVRKGYARFLASVDVVTGECDGRLLPTMAELYELFCGCDDADAKILANSLSPFVNGCWTTFSQQTNVRHEKRLVVYDFMCSPPLLHTSSIMAVLEFVKARYVYGRQRQVVGEMLWVVIDDVYYLLRTETGAEFLNGFVRRLRPRGCVFTGVTQCVNILLAWDVSRSMLANVDYVHWLKLAEGDRTMLGELFGRSEEEMQDNTIIF